jgi:hypothetical protein
MRSVQVVRAGFARDVAVEGYGGKVMLFESSSLDWLLVYLSWK